MIISKLFKALDETRKITRIKWFSNHRNQNGGYQYYTIKILKNTFTVPHNISVI